MNKPLVSVIIPIYNVEKYLRRCVDSVISQTYDRLEIILVDDGSPDQCGRICDEYKEHDERIIVIHKENGGLSDARNVALAICKGNYITFIDSDDWVSEFYVEHLVNAEIYTGADLTISMFENVFENHERSKPVSKDIQSLEIVNTEECYKRLLYQEGIEFSVWGKLYKRGVMIDLKYPVGKLYEDIPVTTEVIHRSNKIAVIQNVDYYYYFRNNSIQQQEYTHKKMDAIYHVQQMKEFIDNEYPTLFKATTCRTFCATCNILFQIKNRGEYQRDINELWLIIKNNRRLVLSDRQARKKARIAALISYLGFPMLKVFYSFNRLSK